MSVQRSYRTLWLIVGGLLLPFVLAGTLYFSGWRPAVKVQGELLPSGPSLLGEESLGGKWGLALVTGARCDSRCIGSLDELRRVHVALYKSMPAVKRLWLSDAEQLGAHAEELHRRWPDLSLIVTDSALRDALLDNAAALPASTAAAEVRARSAAADAVVVFDPAGRAVLRYVQPVDPRAVLSDLRRLLSPTR